MASMASSAAGLMAVKEEDFPWPDAKRRRRFCTDPDLRLEVEGTIFELRSTLCMLASPVFGKMLQSGMREAEEGCIRLPGKLAEEFRLVLPWLNELDPVATVTKDSLEVLLRWAREYEISRLSAACERFLCNEAVTVAELKRALDFNLQERTAQCITAISTDIPSHVAQLQQVSDQGEVMQHLWPSIFRAAGMPVPQQTILHGVPAELWPLIQAAVTHRVALIEVYAGQDVHYDDYSGCKIKRVFPDFSAEIHVPGVGIQFAQPGEWRLKKRGR